MKNKSIRRLITVSLVLLLAIVFSLTSDYFLTFRNISQLLREAAFTGILAVGMSFVMIGGGIDLSLGGIVCAVAIIAQRIAASGLPGFVVLLLAVLLGCVFGFINSMLVTRLHMTEFVATLASGFVYSGLSLILAYRSGNAVVSVAITNKSVLQFGKTVGGIYYITIAWLIVIALAMVVMLYTTFGRHTYAIGSSAKSARMSGVNNDRIKICGFLIAGGLAGLAALMVIAFQSSATVSVGTGMEFQAIAACVVGGIAMSGGKGDALGASLGALFMAMLLNGLNKFGLSTAWQYVYQGAIIVAATAFDAWFQNIARGRRRLRTAEDLRALEEKKQALRQPEPAAGKGDGSNG